MKNAKDMTPDTEHLRVFSTGDYGTGKSVFASTFPTPGFVFDFDKGIQIYMGEDWDYEQFPTSANGWVQFEKTFNTVKKGVADKYYKTIVVDSTTTMNDCAMERALQIDPKRSATDGPLWNVHYQHCRNLMEPKLRAFSNWPCNLVLVSHLEVIQDQETGAILGVEPLLVGKLSKMVPGYFGEIYYHFTANKEGQTVYKIRTVTRGHYKARSRLSGQKRMLHDELPNHYNAVWASYNKKLEEREEGGN